MEEPKVEVFECIRKRREIREYTNEQIPDKALWQILESGRLAPSSKNSQPWHFIVVKDRNTLAKIASLTPTGTHIAKAPLAIAVFMESAKLPHVDGARAVQNMMLVAWELGVGSCWITNFQDGKVKELLGVPSQFELVTVVPFGYPLFPKTSRKKRRKHLSEIAHLERYGNPIALGED